MNSESTSITNINVEKVMKWIKDKYNIISVLPYVVKVEDNSVTFRFTRFLFFSFEPTFLTEYNFIGDKLVEYKFKNAKDELKILIVNEGRDTLRIAVSYSGEKEWIVSKGLKKILDEIVRGIVRENQKAIKTTESVENYSHSLSRLSLISKLIMKSKLVKSEEVNLKVGGVLSYVEEVISQNSNYPIIYVSGSGENSLFRLLFINGELKGVYIMKDNKESFDEKEIDKLEGNFKIHVYVGISPAITTILSGE
ncbi:MAG: hypothetical protein QXM24_02585 [Saccharolobus sp.]